MCLLLNERYRSFLISHARKSNFSEINTMTSFHVYGKGCEHILDNPKDTSFLGRILC